MHRSASVRVVAVTDREAITGQCVRQLEGGALLVTDIGTVDQPMMCVSTGDFGAPLLAPQDGNPSVLESVGVASQGDDSPCSTITTYFSQTVFRQNWIRERIQLFSG